MLFDILCCRSGTKGKRGEVDTVLTTGVSSCGVQSINTDQGQNSGRRCISHATGIKNACLQGIMLYINTVEPRQILLADDPFFGNLSAFGCIYQPSSQLLAFELRASNLLF